MKFISLGLRIKNKAKKLNTAVKNEVCKYFSLFYLVL